MEHQTNPLQALEQAASEQQQAQQANNTASSIHLDPIDLTELVVELGKGALDLVSSLTDHIDF